MNTLTTTLLSAAALATPLAAATLTVGHVDAIGIGYESGALEPHIHADPTAVVDGLPIGNAPDGAEFEPDQLVIAVPQTTYDYVATSGGRAAGSAWDPIGVGAGESYWFLPQGATLSNTLGAPYAGIASEELTAADWSGPIQVTLTAAGAPAGGHFALSRVNLGVPTFYMSTLGGIDASDTYGLTAGDHAHFNWYFTKPGRYELSFDFAGTHLLDGPKTASATYTFQVVPEPSVAVLGALAGLTCLRRRR